MNWHRLIGYIFEKKENGLVFRLEFFDYYGDVGATLSIKYTTSSGYTRTATITSWHHVDKEFKDIEEFLNKVDEEIKKFCKENFEVFESFKKHGWKLVTDDP